MVTLNSNDLLALIASFMWPFTRIMGLIMVAPLFGNLAVPARIKVALGVMLALLVAPTLSGPQAFSEATALTATDLLSLPAILVLVQQFIIGAAMGFAVRLVFAAVEMAGELTGMTMGLGFATFFDPQTRGQSSAISQFLALLVLMFYLATNLHLLLLSTLVNSFSSMPISVTPISGSLYYNLTQWAGNLFSFGVQLSLPMVAVLLITNAALGILTRAAPQLNIFGIGFPVTIGVGLLTLALVLPYLAAPLESLFAAVFLFLEKPV